MQKANKQLSLCKSVPPSITLIAYSSLQIDAEPQFSSPEKSFEEIEQFSSGTKQVLTN